MVDSIPIHFNDLLHDVSLHHLSAIQAQASIVHGQENRMGLILGRRIDLKEQDFFLQPVYEILQCLALKLIREEVCNILIPVHHVLRALIVRLIGHIIADQCVQAKLPVIHINVEALGPKVIIIDHVVELDATEALCCLFLLQVIQINQQKRQ